jgi:hypothetical protein
MNDPVMTSQRGLFVPGPKAPDPAGPRRYLALRSVHSLRAIARGDATLEQETLGSADARNAMRARLQLAFPDAYVILAEYADQVITQLRETAKALPDVTGCPR